MELIPSRPGTLEVIAGCMFSGKSEELIRRLRRSLYARQKVQAFKPSLDTRWDGDRGGEIKSHDKRSIPSITVNRASDIEERIDPDTRVVGIDEAQFFDPELVEVATRLSLRGLRVICAGLDLDYLGNPFEPMPRLIANADYVTKVLAVCVRCGGPGTRSQRLVDSKDRVLIGDEKIYEPRCRHCFDPQAGAGDSGAEVA